MVPQSAVAADRVRHRLPSCLSLTKPCRLRGTRERARPFVLAACEMNHAVAREQLTLARY